MTDFARAHLTPEQAELERHRCEVRDVIRMYLHNGRDGVSQYLLLVRKSRNAEQAERIRVDTWAQIKAGNTGAKGEWK